MIRRRLYNPAQLTPDELKASFVAREDTLAEMLRLIGEQPPGRPCQHVMLIGPRGMGKTTLGLRFLHAIGDTPDLAARWQPVAFYEESYEIGDLADFWLAALRHLTRATNDPRWADRADALARDEGDRERLAAYALSALTDCCRENGKRLILFVENLDTIFRQLRDEREIHALRATLIERPEILLLGSANAVFQAIRGHGEPFYEFFRLFILEGLGREDAHRILAALAGCEGRPEIPEAMKRERGRLEAIRRLTGGNPRLLVLACRMLIESPLGSAFEDLERLIDEQTPYFKARIEELPIQARKVFHCLAEGWKPMLAKEVAGTATLSSSHASAQLRQLVEKGYAREIHLPRAKRARYEVSDRFYNIYYLLRFSRTERDRLERLVTFLHDLFGPAGMRTMYPATLATLRGDGIGAGEIAEWLGVLASHVARDQGFKGREDWLREALDIAMSRIGPGSSIVDRIQREFATQERLNELMQDAIDLFGAGRLSEATAKFRNVIEKQPDNVLAWTLLGLTLMQEHPEESIAALEHVPKHVVPDDPAELRALAAMALTVNGVILVQLARHGDAVATLEQIPEYTDPDDKDYLRVLSAVMELLTGSFLAMSDRHEEAIAAWQRASENVRPDDPEELRGMAAEALKRKGDALAELGRHEEAIAAWQRASENVRPDDPEELRGMAAEALKRKGDALAELGRHEEAIAAWQRASENVRPGDPEELRGMAAEALRNKGDALAKLGQHEEAIAAWEQTTEYIFVEDPTELRHVATRALGAKGLALSRMEHYDDSTTAWHWASQYVRPDDPEETRQVVVMMLAVGSRLFNLHGKHREAEAACRKATYIEPMHHESWQVLAEAILYQDDDARLPEAEDCARRAVELAPENPGALHTLSDVLACRGSWTEALDRLAYALHIGGDVFQEREWPGLTESLIPAVAAGHGSRVKRMMEEAGLTEPMEPLWHAIRAELGEELEPLPVEIMETVTDLRQEFSD